LRPFICVAPDTSLAQAFEQMKHAEIDAIFVCEDGHVTGIFSRHEVLACTGDGTLNTARPVRDFMVTAFAQLTSDATIGQVVETMNERAVHHVAIAAPSRAVVDERARWLLEVGATVESGPAEYDYSPGYYAVFFHDPDGIKLEIVHRAG